MSLYSKTFYNDEFESLVGDRQFVQYMLQVESDLARSQAKYKIIPDTAAQIIADCCQIQFIDLEKLISEIHLGGNAAIPLVQQLTRIVKNNHFESSKYIHLGATSQDIIDTATILQIKDCLIWFEQKLNRLQDVLIELTKQHRNTLMIGRTLLQYARPITFGLKSSSWLQSIVHTQQRIRECKTRVLKIQLFGAVGSGNVYLPKEVVEDVSISLGIAHGFPWHSIRDNIAEWASTLGILNGSLGKIAKDISLLMQSEDGEVSEGSSEGKGVSSVMPHKRNPVTCALIIANSIRTPHLVASILSSMTQEHERSTGLWHAEWEVLTQLISLTAGSLSHTLDLIENLEVHEEKMTINLEMTKGLIYAEQVSNALTATLGRMQANDVVQKACKLAIKKNKSLKEVLTELYPDLFSDAILDELFNPVNSLGNSLDLIDLIVARQGSI
ncbi:MAG: adenylosuccinate lyase family protein [Saprospiraceae bacterium]